MTIVDDQIAENPEQLFADFNLFSDNDRVVISPNTATLTITDNDGENYLIAIVFLVTYFTAKLPSYTFSSIEPW